MKQSNNVLKDSKLSGFSQSYEQENKVSSRSRLIQEKGTGQTNSLDLKKINLTKSPKQSNSSLELLILLLSKCLRMSLQQILGLFTNQNKYLAHIIVKGVNQSFQGIRDFYSQLNENIQTFKRLYNQDQDDAFACFYAVKPGLISKDEQVSELTINLFSHFTQIYNWFISSQSKCSNTLLLGFKRHDRLNQKYATLLFSLIQNHQVDYFQNYYSKSISSSRELLIITSRLVKYLSKRKITISEDNQELLTSELQKKGVCQKWLAVAQQFYENNLEDKLLVLEFLGSIMTWTPQIIQKNQLILNSIRQNWATYQIVQFVPLFNELLIILEQLANAKSSMSRKLYNIIIDIFNDTYQMEDKKDYIVNGFMTLLPQFPNIPSDLFIKNYQLGKLNSSDFLLICEAIDISQDQINLIKIGEVLKEIFFFDVVSNFYLGNLIPEVVKKIMKSQTKATLEFIMNLIKNVLSNYSTCLSKIKSLPKNQADQAYLGMKKSLDKSRKNQKSQAILINKKADIIISLCQRIIDAILAFPIQQTYLNTLKNYILIANSDIKKHNFGIGSKKLNLILQKKFSLTKQQEGYFQDQLKSSLGKPSFRPSESNISHKSKQNYLTVASLSRVQVPEKIIKQFDEIVAKRKKDEQTKIQEQIKKKKQQEMKKIIYKKQLQKMNLIKGGFGQGEAEPKEEGFWNRLVKQTQQIKVVPNQLIQDAYLDAADLIFKKYNKLFKYFFVNYSSSMYSVKATNFNQNSIRKQTLSTVEVIKFLKDYQIIFLTNPTEVQHLIRQINVKLFHRKQVVNQLDFEGFQQFIKQYCLCFWVRNSVSEKNNQKRVKKDHLSLPQLIKNLIDYLRSIFVQKRQNLSFFQIAEFEVQSYNLEINQLNQRLNENTNYILPEGFKKIIDKRIQFKPFIKNQFQIQEKYQVCLQLFDQIIFKKLTLHLIQPHSQKIVKAIAKPFHQINVRDRDPAKMKARAYSTIIDRKVAVQSSMASFLTKNDLSKSIKKAMLLLKNEDKIIGEQVAFTLEQMLIQISKQKQQENNPLVNKLRSLRKQGQTQKNRGLSHRRLQSITSTKLEKTPQNMNPLKDVQKLKKQIQQRRRQKQQEQKKRQQEEAQKIKKKKQLQQRYYQQQKQKLQEKRRLEQQENFKKKEVQQRKVQIKKNKQKFEEFNSKQVDRLKQQFAQIIDRKKKNQEDKQSKNQENQEKMRRIRAKIQNQDKIISKIRKQTAIAILDLQQSESFKSLVKQYQQPLKAVFQYLEKHMFKPLNDRKCKEGEIGFDTWLKFNKIFQLSPLIVNSKDVINIFKAVTKEKRVSKQYIIGLSYEQFLQAMLRQCIKQKTIFQKITSRIKDETVAIEKNSKNSKSKVVSKVELKNQFEQDEQLDVKVLLKQQDIRDDIIDHYGDISIFNIDFFKGFIYYLRMPFTKKGQQKRIKQLVENQRQPQVLVSNIQKLREKLKLQYTLERYDNKQKKDKKVQAKQKTQKTERKQSTEVKSKKSQKK